MSLLLCSACVFLYLLIIAYGWCIRDRSAYLSISVYVSAFVVCVLFYSTYVYSVDYSPQYLSVSFGSIVNVGINIGLYIDSVGTILILLSGFITFICICVMFLQPVLVDIFSVQMLLLISSFSILCFEICDLFYFFVSFEGFLLPLFVLIGGWGSRVRRIRASYYLLFYTFFGSIFYVLGMYCIFCFYGTTDVHVITYFKFPVFFENFLFVILCVPFLVKMPVFPFHAWLPEAHVEASTIGSIFLGGILLKVGGFGMYRFAFSIFSIDVGSYWLPLLLLLSAISLVYISCIIFVQIDLKKIIAYSSICHMSISVIALCSLNVTGFVGFVNILVSHGLSCSALFLLIGYLYSFTGTRNLSYYRGLFGSLPIFSFAFLFFNLVSIGFPGTSGFVGEFFTLVSSFSHGYVIPICILFCAFLGTAYSFWVLNRLIFGMFYSFSDDPLKDLDLVTFCNILLLGWLCLFVGWFPQLLNIYVGYDALLFVLYHL
jgi:NADH-quinone oxidoreductase subunit M